MGLLVRLKECTGCHRQLPATREHFHLHAPSKDGLKPRCKECRRTAVNAAYASLSPLKKAEYLRSVERWRTTNAQLVRRYARAWRRLNPERRREIKAEFHQRKKATDPRYKICAAMSCAIGKSLRGKKAGRRWQVLVGYSAEQLKAHLEKQFEPGMTWANHGEWHVDHKRPIASFAIKSASDQAFKECWSLSNLQPLWAEDNLRKWAKWAS